MAESKSLLLKKDPCHCDNCKHFHESGCDCLVEPEIHDLFGCLQYEPTADVAPVVRCRDCKHWMDIDNGRQKHEMCAQLMPDWFCADGERREECGE